MNKKVKVLYITGNGHSGSTLLDMILGNSPNTFSVGELTFISRETILEEYCSCGKLIGNCEFWSVIWSKWEKRTGINISEYRKLRLKFERNKTTIRTFVNKIFPSKDFKKYCECTKVLFGCIQEVTGAEVIIDSSKSPQRIPVLNRSVDLKVIHLCRNAKGVLNSAKKSYKKDMKAGIEVDLPERRTSKTLVEWVFVNLICEIFCIGVNSKKLKYESYIGNLKRLEKIDESIKITKQSFSTPHMIAGNKIRLDKDIKINNSIGFKYSRLSPRQFFMADLFDKVFFWWT